MTVQAGSVLKWGEVRPGMLVRGSRPTTYEVCIEVDGVAVGLVLGHAAHVDNPGAFSDLSGRTWLWDDAFADESADEEFTLVAHINGSETGEQLREMALAFERSGMVRAA